MTGKDTGVSSNEIAGCIPTILLEPITRRSPSTWHAAMSAADRPSRRSCWLRHWSDGACHRAWRSRCDWGWLSSGSAGTDAALSLFSLAIAAGNLWPEQLAAPHDRPAIARLGALASGRVPTPAGTGRPGRSRSSASGVPPEPSPQPERDGLTGSALGCGDARRRTRRCSIVPLAEQGPAAAAGDRHRPPARHQRPARLRFGDELLRQFARRLTAVAGGRRWRPGWAATGSRCSCRTRRAPSGRAIGRRRDRCPRPARSCIAGCELSLRVHCGCRLVPRPCQRASTV